jgi:hypothetical protein
MNNKYSKLKVLEGFIGNCVDKIKKAAPRFEGGDKFEKLCYNKGS